MTSNAEELSYRLPDRIVHDEYLDPDFWLSGAYADFATSSVRFIPIGDHAARWIYAINDEDALNFAALMADITAIGGKKSVNERLTHVINGMPANVFFLKGTTESAIDLHRNDPKYLSQAAREEMCEFARAYPDLLDVLRYMSREDFQTSRIGTYLTPAELVTYGRMPGNRFLYWQKCFPWLLNDLYTDVQLNRKHQVVSYKVHPMSEDLADYLGVPTDIFEDMDE